MLIRRIGREYPETQVFKSRCSNSPTSSWRSSIPSVVRKRGQFRASLFFAFGNHTFVSSASARHGDDAANSDASVLTRSTRDRATRCLVAWRVRRVRARRTVRLPSATSPQAGLPVEVRIADRAEIVVAHLEGLTERSADVAKVIGGDQVSRLREGRPWRQEIPPSNWRFCGEVRRERC